MVDSLFKDHLGESRLFGARTLVAGVFVVAALLLVVARLAHLQIESHQHFSTLSQDNRVKIEPQPPTRGLIYDANGILLAENYPSFSLEITLEKVDDLQATISELARIVRIDEKDRRRF